MFFQSFPVYSDRTWEIKTLHIMKALPVLVCASYSVRGKIYMSDRFNSTAVSIITTLSACLRSGEKKRWRRGKEKVTNPLKFSKIWIGHVLHLNLVSNLVSNLVPYVCGSKVQYASYFRSDSIEYCMMVTALFITTLSSDKNIDTQWFCNPPNYIQCQHFKNSLSTKSLHSSYGIVEEEWLWHTC